MDNLRVGIIAEGKSDHAVIANILEGILGIDINEQVQFLVPQLTSDKTYIGAVKNDEKSFSNWTIVRQNCIDKEEIDNFFSDNPLEQDLILIIQIDTAERDLINYEVSEPPKTKDKNYSEKLRLNVITKIKEWLNQPYENLYYAIAIEETEAWILALHEKNKSDTCEYNKAKEAYFKMLNKTLKKKEKNVLTIKDAFVKYDQLSRPFRKNRTLKKARNKNKSLDLFCHSLEKDLINAPQEKE